MLQQLICLKMASFSTGVFTDTVGLSYKCGDLSGTTSSPNGQFQYYDGDDISFSIGSLQLGVAKGRQRLSVLDLVDNPSLSNPKLLNRAALLFSLTPSLGFEKAIQINDDVSYTQLPIYIISALMLNDRISGRFNTLSRTTLMRLISMPKTQETCTRSSRKLVPKLEYRSKAYHMFGTIFDELSQDSGSFVTFKFL